MRIVFMGTPWFAAASLKRLIDEGYDIVGVFSQPDKPSRRGMKVAFGPVKSLALDAGIPVAQPATLRGGAAMDALRSMDPELIVVVAYGKILPDEVIYYPHKGTINVHASLLPKYRGAAPIQHAVLNGDAVTGVTTMFIAPELDSGDIIYSEKTEIGEFETSGELFERLSGMGAELLCKTVNDIEAGTAPRTAQNHTEATFAPPLKKELCAIDWTRSPREIVKHICGLDPWPVATAEFDGKTFKIFGAQYTDNTTGILPGGVVSAGKPDLEVACGGGRTLMITHLQAPNGKRMSAADYLRGHPLTTEDGK